MSERLLRLTLVAACAVALAVALAQLRKRHILTDETVQSIEDQLLALDPATRAAVVARLAVDAKTAVSERMH